MLCGSLERKLESAAALEDAFSNCAPLLSPELERQKVIDNLVQVRTNKHDTNGGSNLGTGLLLTEDGFILTAYHVVSDVFQYWNGQKANNKKFSYDDIDVFKEARVISGNDPYLIDLSFLSEFPAADLALIKILTTVKPKPTGVHFFNGPMRGAVKSLGRPVVEDFNSLYEQQGIITSYLNNDFDDLSHSDTLITDAKVRTGLSGGVFVNDLGEIVGQIQRQLIAEQHSMGVSSRYIMECACDFAAAVKKAPIFPQSTDSMQAFSGPNGLGISYARRFIKKFFSF